MFQTSAVSSFVLFGLVSWHLQNLSLLCATTVLPISACLLEMQFDLAAEPGMYIMKLQLLSCVFTSQELQLLTLAQ